MKALFAIVPLLLAFTFIDRPAPPVMQDEPKEQSLKGMENNMFAEDNEACLKCHGEKYFILSDTTSGSSRKRRMNDDYFVDRDRFYQSNHWSFACTDCHSYDFYDFPHTTSVRLEEHLSCNDCHAYDEQYAQYHFEDIDVEYMESTHFGVEGFSCWKCHNPHSYEIDIRNSTNLESTILYDNNICLGCHTNSDDFNLLSDRQTIDILSTHDWLPGSELHFRSVRCIECHTEVNDSILVAHKVLPKENAVRRCTECHSSNSRLLNTLYKQQDTIQGSNIGFNNSVILNQSYVIGANSNILLEVLSYIIFGGLLAIIVFHILIRIIK